MERICRLFLDLLPISIHMVLSFPSGLPGLIPRGSSRSYPVRHVVEFLHILRRSADGFYSGLWRDRIEERLLRERMLQQPRLWCDKERDPLHVCLYYVRELPSQLLKCDILREIHIEYFVLVCDLHTASLYGLSRCVLHVGCYGDSPSAVVVELMGLRSTCTVVKSKQLIERCEAGRTLCFGQWLDPSLSLIGCTCVEIEGNYG